MLCRWHLALNQNRKTLLDSYCIQEYRQVPAASVSAVIELIPSGGESSHIYYISMVSIKISNAICGY